METLASTSTPYDGAARLTTRVGSDDELFVRRLYGLVPGSVPAPYRPGRLVVDAHVPLSVGGARMAEVARHAGVPYLIDPETYYLQDAQHAGAPWCRVPYAKPEVCTPADLMSAGAQDALVASVLDYQIKHGASEVIAPYLHVESPAVDWARAQAGLWRRTAAYLEDAGINLPVIALVAVGWRCLHPLQGLPALAEMWDALASLSPDEVALAASKVHLGAHPEDRIAELLMLVRDLSRTYKVTMWQQGLLGEAGVIEGAAGYECGVGWRETCDLTSRMSQHRSPRDGRPGARPVYIPELGRGVSKRRLEFARASRPVWARVVCPFPDCCAPGGQDLVGDARRHSVVARARELDRLDTTRAAQWRWNQMAQRLDGGLDLADRLNELAPPSSAVPGVDLGSMQALHVIASARRARRGRAVRRSA